jgi:hypothetical protein
MLPDTKSIRRVALAMMALTALALGACANTPLLMPYTSAKKETVKAPPAPNPARVSSDLQLLHTWFNAPSAMQSEQLAAAEQAYRSSQTPRDTLRLALLLGIPGTPSTNLPRAQRLLSALVQDPSDQLLPSEHTLAQLALTFIANRLTVKAESRTLQTADAAKIAQLKAQLDAVTDQDVALKRQLEQARAKLAAIANIEKSLNEGKLGTTGPP